MRKGLFARHDRPTLFGMPNLHNSSQFANYDSVPEALAFFQRDEPSQCCAKIMLVDDDPTMTMLFRTYLESFGYRDFVICNESTAVLETILEQRPDVVFLDVVMPTIDGLQILRELRKNDELSMTPVIVVTADTNPATKLEALESGATDFLGKPVDPSELVLRLRNVLQIKAFQDHLGSYADRLERAVSERTAQLVLTQRQVSQGYRAGKAEIAMEVLHNVGNALNSVNVSVTMIHKELMDSRLPFLKKATQLLDDNIDTPDFFAVDERGKMLPSYLIELSTALMKEREDNLKELETLFRHLGHIKAIVATQQKNVDLGGQLESISLPELVNDAAALAGLPADDIVVIREFDVMSEHLLDKQKLIQVFLNLIKNAQQSLLQMPSSQRQLTLRVHEHRFDRIRVEFIDTGSGIRTEDLSKICDHGFTTKSDGSGVGLHSCTEMIRELGGTLFCESQGPGQGATFIVELPFTATELSR